MQYQYAVLGSFIIAATTATARAADTPAPPASPTPEPYALLPPPWSGDAAVGYVRTGGNTDTTALNVKLTLDYKGVEWGNSALATAFTGGRDKQTTDERYELADKVNYNLTPRDYGFGNATYDNDRFAGIAQRYALSLGYGRHVIATPVQTLDLEVGAGANYSRDQNAQDFVAHGIATFGGKYVWKITPTSEFSQSLRSEFASNNIFVNPITELKLTVIGNAFATLDFEIRYNSDVPVGIRKLDNITTVNLGYAFGKK